MKQSYVLITGGAGFIGTNLALSYLERNEPVHIFDNLSRPGVGRNVDELRERYPGRVLFTCGDVRSANDLREAVACARIVFHLAAQVAVTTSLADPAADAAINLGGTLNLLEAIRALPQRPPLLFTSTNKVYGDLYRISLAEGPMRYRPADSGLAERGISEGHALEFLSPYGCSKGSADQYVLDYARSYGLPAAVFRMSCIYGPYQLGSEDQGWVAHFLRQAIKGETVTVFGSGKQVRDLLYADDLVQAMHAVIAAMEQCQGQAFNIGGGAANSASLREVLGHIEQLTGQAPRVEWGEERIGDQRWYVSDSARARNAFQWEPATSIHSGLGRLLEWYRQRPELAGRSERQVAQCASL